MTNVDLELASLVDKQIVVDEEETRTFTKSAKFALAIGSVLSLAAVACLSFTSPATLAVAPTSLIAAGNDVAICKGTYIQGVTPRSAEKGCVIISNGDMYGWKADGHDNAMPTITYCIGSNHHGGKLEFSKMDILSHGDLDLDQDGISGISPGTGVMVEVFSEENFKGQSTFITNAEDSGRLFRKQYPDGKVVNDNVKSFKIIADVSDYFAGNNCGIATSVCMGVKNYAETVAEPEDGCITLASVDPTGKVSAQIKTATICATGDVSNVKLDYEGLKAMNMIQKRGNQENQISYIGRGKKIDYVRSYSAKHNDGSNTNLQTGSLTGQKFPDGKHVGDNVNSITFSSTASKLVDCHNKHVIM
jgi:hypothetical protein